MQPLTARLTADATVKTFDSGRSVVKFKVAQNRSYTNKAGDRVTSTKFYECNYWIHTGIAQYLTKGSLVELEGEISARAYTDRNGVAQAVLQFDTRKIFLLSPQKKAANNQGPASNEPDDDLPF